MSTQVNLTKLVRCVYKESESLISAYPSW